MRRPRHARAAAVPRTSSSEDLELIPCQWMVIQHVREKYSCRTREAIPQPPGTIASDRARARRTVTAGRDPVLEVWSALPLNRSIINWYLTYLAV
jgi:hypothetical protein